MTEGIQARAMTLAEHDELVARWHFPAVPLITIELNGRAWGEVDYTEASASIHWALKIKASGQDSVVGLPGLAGQTPDDLDEREGIRVAALDHSLDASADRLGFRDQPLQARDA